MRLLDTTTKQLRTFYGENIPRYAILSHMWGTEKDEVLFRHIAGSYFDRLIGKRRKGYAKIEAACKQAIQDGWKYIWIDTCCIDKESSAELSEAINSMYRWYQNSQVCYVYLEDVQSSGNVQTQSAKDATFPIVPFECSRWFKRGWTLQELIAPQYVVFFSKDWVDIGTKTGPLRNTISAVTRIRVEMLIAYDSEGASVAEKMSWAAFRETTRVEDAAYCLMGLLGVNMPLLYGEGGRAFRRLQEEIMKVSDDDSLFAWKARSDNYNYQYRAGGMLAGSPWDFRDGMNIVQSSGGAYSPYSMTNQGLQIKLPLLPIDPNQDIVGIDSENIFKTILTCTLRNTKSIQWIVIYLKMTREGYYQRIFPHWLDTTDVNPVWGTDVNKLASLLIPQIDPSTTHNWPINQDIEVKILPTESGFTIDGHSLVEGHKDYYNVYGSHKVIYFEHKEKCSGVVIGSNNGIPWLDFANVIDEKSLFYHSYKKGGSQAHVPGQLLDQISEKIPGEDWWMTISVRKAGHSWAGSCFRAFIDIQRIPIQAKGWCIPSVMTAFDNKFSGNFNFPDNLDHHNIHPYFKKEGFDWFVVFNPKAKRLLDVSLVHTFCYDSIVHCVKFSHDGKYLAAGSNMVQVYDMETGAKTCTLIDKSSKKTRHDIYSMCFSPDGKFLATGSYDGQIKLWNIREKCIHKIFNGHQKTVNSLCFSLDSHLIISGSKDGTVQIWDIVDETSKTLTMPFNNHNYRISVSSVAISPNGRLIAAGSSSSIIQIWDMVTVELLAELQEHGDSVHIAFTPDGKGLVSGSTNMALKYWDVSGLVPTGVVEGLSNSRASNTLGGRNVLDNIKQYTITFTGHEDSVNSVAISHNKKYVISGSDDGSVLFWDLKNATALFILKTTLFHSLDTSQVGNMFAVASKERVRVWHYNKALMGN